MSVKIESLTVRTARELLEIPPAEVVTPEKPSRMVRPLITRCIPSPTLRIGRVPPPSRIGLFTPGAGSMVTGDAAEVPEVATENPAGPGE